MRHMRQGSWQTRKGAVLSRLVPIRRQMQRNHQTQEAVTTEHLWNYKEKMRKLRGQKAYVLSQIIVL